MDTLRVVADLPALLIKARISQGLSQKELADPAGAEGTADTAVRGHGLRHRQMVPHQGGGECIRHRPEQPRPARGIPLNRDARYAAPPMGLQHNDASDGGGIVLS